MHEVLEYEQPDYETVLAEGVQLDHRADPTKSRAQYLPLLELSVREAPLDDRNTHYLGREYMFHRRWKECIETLTRHLACPRPRGPDERCASMRFIARAHEALATSARRKNGSSAPWARPRTCASRGWRWPRSAIASATREGTAFFALRALDIQERPKTYICEAAAWGSLPFDLASLALYETGRVREAIPLLEKAVELEPSNERLRENLRLMRTEKRRG